MQFFDTHAHLDDEQFQDQLDAVIGRARDAEVVRMVTVGTTVASSALSVKIAHRYPEVYAAVGIQPNYGQEVSGADWEQVQGMACDPRVRAIGETGLDAYWDFTPWKDQCRLFADHIELAQRTGLPLIVHMRDCGEQIVEMLTAARSRGPLRGVMHSFSGTESVARDCLALGLHISLSGMVTFKKSSALRDLARVIPQDRLLIETDAPYLSPHPHRGTRPNEPSLLRHTAQCLADVLGMSLPALAELTTANARAFFAIAPADA